MSGERRAAYAHVLSENRPAFEHYIEMHLAHCIELRASADLIRHGWFGPLPAHPGLHSRTGDYTLIMKDNWTVKDSVPGEKPYTLLGVHGGTSRAEMRIPLVAVRV